MSNSANLCLTLWHVILWNAKKNNSNLYLFFNFFNFFYFFIFFFFFFFNVIPFWFCVAIFTATLYSIYIYKYLYTYYTSYIFHVLLSLFALYSAMWYLKKKYVEKKLNTQSGKSWLNLLFWFFSSFFFFLLLFFFFHIFICLCDSSLGLRIFLRVC